MLIFTISLHVAMIKGDSKSEPMWDKQLNPLWWGWGSMV